MTVSHKSHQNARHPYKKTPLYLRRSNLNTWITYKNQAPYYQYLHLFTQVIQSIFLQETTYNPHQKLTRQVYDRLPNQQHNLLKTLIHSSTLINHTYRTYTDQGYESTKEDILNATRLLQLQIDPVGLLWIKTKLIYWELQRHYGDEPFTTKQASGLLFITKGTLRKHLRALCNADHLQIVKIGSNNTHYYQII